MIEKGVQPDNHTFVGVLKATSHIGDVKTAGDMIGYIKNYQIPMSEFIYNGLIKTYAGACRIKDVAEEHLDLYIDDIWRLVENMNSKGIEMNIHILNSIVLAYCNAA